MMPEPRVLVPASVGKGETFTVKALIIHPMETGLRSDENGKIIPRKIINKFVCRYAGESVFSADFFESLAANPYLEFYITAIESGPLEFIWEEDGGAVTRLSRSLVVVSS